MQVISVNNNYSSGMRRFAAFIIDHMLLGAIFSAMFWQVFDWPMDFGDYGWHNWNWDLVITGRKFLNEALIIIYYALMESSKYQATLGKIVMGIKVVNKDGRGLDFSKALLRNLSKLLSAFILGIGYIMIIFDDRKQGLHDKIAETFVVKQ